MDIHESIKSAREEKGLSQSQVAEAIGIAYQNYWKIENGKTELSVSRLYQIADVLDVPVRELLGIEPPIDTLLLDRIKELEKEVGYLYKLLQAKEDNEEMRKKYVEALIDIKLNDVRYYSGLNVGKIIFTHKVTGEVVTVPWEDLEIAEHSPIYADLNKGIENEEYNEEVILSESETNLIRLEAIQQNYDYWNLLDSLGYIKDETFQKLIYQQGIILSKKAVR